MNDRWNVEGCGPPSYEVEYGTAVCPRCPCLLTRLSAVEAIDCACPCHATQRFLLRRPVDVEAPF